MNLWAPSVQMKNRLNGGEVVGLVILSAYALDDLVRDGIVAGRFESRRRRPRR